MGPSRRYCGRDPAERETEDREDVTVGLGGPTLSRLGPAFPGLGSLLVRAGVLGGYS